MTRQTGSTTRLKRQAAVVLGAGVGLAALTSVLSTPAMAQAAPTVSRPVVQPLPNPATRRLSAALARLGSAPRDLEALVEAGEAAGAMGDFAASSGFFERAQQVAPRDGRVLSGLAQARVMAGDAPAALALYADADKAGVPIEQTALQRGLAHDLVGDNGNAQRFYRMVLGSSQDAQARLRLAVSQAIAGETSASETTLMPLLRQQDKPAWRTHAFALAIAGDTAKAVETVNTILPANLAAGIAPYLRYMPRLTPAQQAAAANLGKFPRASEIGQDDSKVLAWVAAHPPVRLATADAGLVPRGEPLGRPGRGRKPAASTPPLAGARQASAAPPPEPRPAIVRENAGELPPASPAKVPAVRAPAPVLAETPRVTLPAPAPAVAAATPAPTTGPAPVSARPNTGAAGFDLARLGPVAKPAAKPVPPMPAPVPAPAPAAVPPVSLAEVFADLGAPTMTATPAPGAVDISALVAARPAAAGDAKAKAEAVKAEVAAKAKATAKKPAPPAHPSRIWVQIGIGSDKSAIAYDWKHRSKAQAALLKGKGPWLSENGRTNRILVGPFETRSDANAFVAQAKKAEMDTMIWTSPAGQVVDRFEAD